MFIMKKFELKLFLFLTCACLAMLLTACVSTSCSMQAVAGGAQFCEETLAGN